QLLILSYAATTDLKNVRLGVLDEDHTARSRRVSESFFQNNIFVEADPPANALDLEAMLFRGEIDAAVWIPRGFEQDLTSGETAAISITIDGQNSNSAGRSLGYVQGIIRAELLRRFEELRDQQPELADKLHQIQPVTRYFYNPELESRFYMVPAILVMLVTIISVMLTGMAVVREKEIGTLEQLLVTPLSGGQIIAGMTIPYALLVMVEFTIAVVITLFWFGVPLLGSLGLLYLSALVYLLTALGGGLLVSTVSNTQQQSMFTVFFFLIFFIMTSGFFFPVENMPDVIYYLSYLNPMRYLMSIIRGIFLKGATFSDVLPHLLPLILMGMAVFSFAVFRFRKRLA
ncbi:ABC transporter permease, partial [bacterium]|nr:ABC transporter permease [bacterium]